jgi:hypothetical protein
LLLQAGSKPDTLATAVALDSMEQPFFACMVRDKALTKYLEGRADLHYAFRNAVGEAYYFFDLSEEENGHVKLKWATKQQVERDDIWPQPGFFARSHTTKFTLGPDLPSSTKVFTIDGNWKAADFSSFHGKMSDLYSLFGSLKLLEDGETRSGYEFFSRAVQERFWQGGGSYGSFYDDLQSHVHKFAPLSVQRIQYASPGEIALRGDGAIFSDITRLLVIFESREEELRVLYKSIYQSLKKHALLSAPPNTEFPAEALGHMIRRAAFSLAGKLLIEEPRRLFEACNENTLVFAKVVLSIFRRGLDLYTFTAEGRMRVGS